MNKKLAGIAFLFWPCRRALPRSFGSGLRIEARLLINRRQSKTLSKGSSSHRVQDWLYALVPGARHMRLDRKAKLFLWAR